MKYNIKLLSRQTVAEGTIQFLLEKPAGFEFKAGQYMDLTIPNPPETDAEGNTRAFSITAAPHEDHLSIASRMRDTAFKRVLQKLPDSAPLEMDAPMGSFTLHNNSAKPAVLLAGGIGITPFFSIVKSAVEQKLPHKIYLFYSNRRPEDAAFLKDLQDLQEKNPNYKFIGTMTGMENSKQPWNGETGYINKEMLEKNIAEGLSVPIYYMAGPPAMVAAMRKMLNEAGVNDDEIRSEEFSGY